MTDQRILELDLELNLREDDNAPDGSIAYVYGRAVPYNTPTRIGGVEEQFEADAFDPQDVIGKPLNWRHNEPIGVIVSAANEADGLYIGARILDTVQGRDAATLTRAQAVKGLSVGFTPSKSTWNKARTAVRHLAARMFEVSLTPMPAYATAAVSVVREEQPMSDTVVDTTEVSAEDREAREAVASLRSEFDQLRAVVDVAGREEQHPLAKYRSLQEYAKALVTGVEERVANVSALSEQTGLVPPVWLQDIKGVLDRGRPCINGIGGPMSAGDSGLDIKWPTFAGDLSAIAAVQTNEGDEPNSADIDILVGSATLKTTASYNTLTWQVIDRAQPSYVQAHARILMGAYGTETDYDFQNALWANDVVATGVDYDIAADTTGALFVEAVWKAATEVEFATGAPADVVYVSSAVWNKLPAWSRFMEQNFPVQNVAGVYNLQGLRANIGGLPVVLAREFATDGTEQAIVTNRVAVGYAEDGPRMVTAEKPSAGGRDVAIYGLGVTTPFIPNGIRSIYNTP
jgi:HK97 family phage prohead protease